MVVNRRSIQTTLSVREEVSNRDAKHVRLTSRRACWRSKRSKAEESTGNLACVASVSVWFRSKERPRNGILVFGRAINETRAKKMKVGEGAIFRAGPRSLLLNRTETLATQATRNWTLTLFFCNCVHF